MKKLPAAGVGVLTKLAPKHNANPLLLNAGPGALLATIFVPLTVAYAESQLPLLLLVVVQLESYLAELSATEV